MCITSSMWTMCIPEGMPGKHDLASKPCVREDLSKVAKIRGKFRVGNFWLAHYLSPLFHPPSRLLVDWSIDVVLISLVHNEMFPNLIIHDHQQTFKCRHGCIDCTLCRIPKVFTSVFKTINRESTIQFKG